MWPSLSGSLDSGDTSSPINNIATYIEDYIDLVENVPNDVIRQITQLHEHNHHYQQLLATLENNLEILSTCSTSTAATPSSSSSSSSLSSTTTTSAAPVSETSLSSTTSDEKNNFRKRKCLLSIQRCLIEIQEISDDKLFIIQSVLDQLDSKARQLDYDYRNVVIVNSNSSYQGSSKHSTYSNNLSSLNSSATGDAEYNKDSQYLNNSNSNVNLNSNNECTNHLNNKDTLVNSTAATSGNCNSNSPTHNTIHSSSSTHNGKRARRTLNSSKGDNNGNNNGNSSHNGNSTGNEYTGAGKRSIKRVNKGNKETKRKAKDISGNNSPPAIYEDTPIDPDEPTYCLCKQVSFGEMIGCDNDACPIEWFHFSCVALSSKPKGRWYCPDCRGDRSNIPKK